MSSLQEVMVGLADSIELNKTKGFFGNKRFRGVPWLDKYPETPQEIALNLAQRLEAGGFTVSFDEKDIDREKMGRFIANAVAVQK